MIVSYATSAAASANGQVSFSATPVSMVVQSVVVEIYAGTKTLRANLHRGDVGHSPMPECLTAVTGPRSSTEENSIVNATTAFV